MRTVRSSLLLVLGILATIECSSKPPKPQTVNVRRKHPKKPADTIHLGPPYVPTIKDDDPRVMCASRFVRAMIENDQATAAGMISPGWLREDGISMDTFMVSRLDIHYLPPHATFTITNVRGDLVSVQPIFDSGYVQQLTLSISEEDGKYYVFPSGADHCCGSVDPWYWPPEPQTRQR